MFHMEQSKEPLGMLNDASKNPSLLQMGQTKGPLGIRDEYQLKNTFKWGKAKKH